MLRSLCFVFAISLCAAGVHAQELPQAPQTGDMYLGLSGGAAFVGDSELKDAGFDNDLSFDTGYNLNAAIGTHIGERFRVEGELGWRAADMDEFTVNGTSTSNFSGDIGVLSGMVNGYADFPVHEKFDLYVGAGLGAAHVDADVNAAGLTGDEDTVLAYQGMAGAGWHLSERTTLTGGYRLWTSEDPSFDTGDWDAPLIHTVEVGLRFSF